MKNKILHLVPVYKNYSETFIWSLIELFNKRYESFILVSKINNRPSDYYEYGHISFLSGKDSNILNKTIYKVRSLLYPVCYFNFKGLVRITQEIEPKVIHAHFGYFIYDVLKLSKCNCNIKFVISIHGSDFNSFIRKRKAMIEVLQEINNLDNVIIVVPSNFMKQKILEYVSFKESRIVIINNTYNQLFNSKCDKIKEGDFVNITTTGRLIECKGYFNLINAIAFLKGKGLSIRLNIIGEGELKEKLLVYSSQLDLHNDIIFHGKRDPADIRDILSTSDIYVQPSIVDKDGREESFGVSALEAVAMGIPVLVSDIGGLSETIDSQCPYHFIFKSGCQIDLNEKLLNMIMEKVWDINYCGLNKHLSKFSTEQQLLNWEQIYD